jgi:WD40 repeat protein
MRVCDAANGAELAVLRANESCGYCVAFSPEGNRIASWSDDDTVRVWDARSSAELAVLRGHTRHVEGVAFSPTGDRIVSWADRERGYLEDRTVRVWDAHSGAELAVFRGHQQPLDSVAFSPSGDRIASSSDDDTTVRVWDAASGAELAVLRGHTCHVGGVAFSPTGDRIVSESFDHTVRVWDAASGQCLEVIQGSGDVQAIAAGSQRFPLRALARGLDTVIERADSGKPVAWFPVNLNAIVTHPSDRIWAGSAGNYLCLITLEGDDTLPTGNQPQPPLGASEPEKRP